MEPMKQRFKELWTKIEKYKYPLLVLALGLMLACFPRSGQQQEEPAQAADPVTVTIGQESMDARLESLLSQIDGAGQVRVMLTLSAGEETVYQSDTDSQRSSTVLYDVGSSEEALVRQVLPEVYLGAVVVCQGADDARVRLAVVQAVSALTGLGADQICVIKMK